MECSDSRSRKKKGVGSPSDRTETDEPSDVETLAGIALGCIGMSLDDFARCTPSEFYAAYTSWQKMRDADRRDSWERMRILGACTLQPYSRKQLQGHDVITLPWDKETDRPQTARQPQLSREETLARFEAAKQRAGLK